MKDLIPICLLFLVTNMGTLWSQCIWDTDPNVDPPLLTLGGPYLLKCPGAPIQINVGTDGTPATYSWEGPNGYVSTEEDPDDVLVPGSYRLTVTYGPGCSSSESVEVTGDIPEPPVIDLSVSRAALSCRNRAVRLTAQVNDPLATFSWEGPPGFTPSTLSNPVTRVPGDFTVTVVDKNQCSYELTTTILIDTVKPSVTVDDINAITCMDQSYSLAPTAVGMVHDVPSFSWSGPYGFRATGRNITANQTGLYRLTVRDPVNGCTASDQLNIIAHPNQPVLNITAADLDCGRDEDTMRLEVSNCASCQVEWTLPSGNSSSDLSFPTSEAGSYEVNVTDPSSGCASQAQINITVDTIPINRIPRATPIGCTGPGEVRLFLPANYESIEWLDSVDGFLSNSDRVRPVSPGTIYLNSIDVRGCLERDTFRLQRDADPELQLQLSGDTLNCFRDPVIVGASVTNFRLNQIAEYNWTFADGSTATGATVPVTIDGPFTVEAVASNGCRSSQDTFVPIDFRQPDVSASGGFFDCTQAGIQLNVSISSFTILDVQWSGPRNFWSNRFNPRVTAPGTYTIQVTESNGCVNSATAEVRSQIEALDTMEIIATDINCGSNVGTVRINNIDSVTTYTWQEVGGTSSGTLSNGDLIALANVGRYAIHGLHNPTSCLLVDTISIALDTVRPILQIEPSGIIRCASREVTIESTVDAQVRYEWTTADGQILSDPVEPVALVRDPGTYRVTVVNDRNQCAAQQEVSVQEEPNPLTDLQFVSGRPGCEGERNGFISVTNVNGGRGPFMYSLGGVQFTDRSTFNNLAADTFNIVAEDADGCQIDTIFPLEIVPQFLVDLGNDLAVRLGNGITLSTETDLLPDEIESYRWNFNLDDGCMDDCPERSFVPIESSFFTVEVLSSLGCTRMDTVFVRVIEDGGIFLPNVFSPNNDGINDFAEVFSGPAIASIDLFEIFDRWGRMVFTAENFLPGDQNARWDGSSGSTLLNPGVYIYALRAIDIKGEPRDLVGEIMLMR